MRKGTTMKIGKGYVETTLGEILESPQLENLPRYYPAWKLAWEIREVLGKRFYEPLKENVHLVVVKILKSTPASTKTRETPLTFIAGEIPAQKYYWFDNHFFPLHCIVGETELYRGSLDIVADPKLVSKLTPPRPRCFRMNVG
jgi:hypothetical protein